MKIDEVPCCARGLCELPAGHAGQHAWHNGATVVLAWNYQFGPKPKHKHTIPPGWSSWASRPWWSNP